ncbi:hypothetical protein [Chitinophaga pinensis]|uniref:hypothetical protein n=1 Tax=Chitinophaga pinensis TaxID=79329 RepID=UPI001C98F983|nr:hypothetical protein [Chitinophaga pinensis]
MRKNLMLIQIISRAKRSEIEVCATTQPVSGAGMTVPSALCTPRDYSGRAKQRY